MVSVFLFILGKPQVKNTRIIEVCAPLKDRTLNYTCIKDNLQLFII